MKLGSESRSTLTVLFVLAMTSAFLAGSWFRSSPNQSTLPAPEPVPQRMAINSPMLQLELLKEIERAEYLGGGRNIFRKLDLPRPPEPRPEVKAEKEEQLQPDPIPTIALKFFGFARRVGESARIFLTEGDDVFIAGEGEIVNRRYRVVRISPASVEIEDVLTNHSEHIPLSEG
jgi:hypothetical protein